MPSPATVAKPAISIDLLDKFDLLKTELRGELFERDDEIDVIALALVGALHCFFWGTPGIAKTYSVDRALKRIVAKKFSILLGRLLGYEDTWGPLDLPGLRDGRYRRLVDGYLPDADVGELDEIFKAGDSLLNSLLKLMNEGEYRNDGQIIKARPLIFSMSNEGPATDNLAALYDRLPLRCYVEQVKDDGNLVKVLQSEPPEDPPTILTWDDVRQAQAESAALPVAPAFWDQIVKLNAELRTESIMPTTRKLKQVVRAARAEAWLDGSDTVGVPHLIVAQHMLWDRPDQIPDLTRIVLDIANPLEKDTRTLAVAIEEIAKLVDQALVLDVQNERDEDRHHNLGMEIMDKIADATKDLQAIIAQSGTGRRQRDLISHCRGRLHALTVVTIKDIFNLPEDAIDDMSLGLPDMPAAT